MAALLFCAATLHAQTDYTWTGGGGTSDWLTPANWGGGGYPGQNANDTATINNNAEVELTAHGGALTIAGITMGGAAGTSQRVWINANWGAGSLAVNGPAVFNAASGTTVEFGRGSLTLPGNADIMGGDGHDRTFIINDWIWLGRPWTEWTLLANNNSANYYNNRVAFRGLAGTGGPGLIIGPANPSGISTNSFECGVARIDVGGTLTLRSAGTVLDFCGSTWDGLVGWVKANNLTCTASAFGVPTVRLVMNANGFNVWGDNNGVAVSEYPAPLNVLGQLFSNGVYPDLVVDASALTDDGYVPLVALKDAAAGTELADRWESIALSPNVVRLVTRDHTHTEHPNGNGSYRVLYALAKGGTPTLPWVTVSFDWQDNATVTTGEYVAGDPLYALPVPSHPAGFAFLGWNTQSDGEGATVTAASAAPPSATTYYAQWQESVTPSHPEGFTKIGAIRWDAYVGAVHDVAFHYENALSGVHLVNPDDPSSPGANLLNPANPPTTEFHWRVPWYGYIKPDNRVLMRNTNLLTVEKEIRYAKAAGIDYWATCWYGDHTDTGLSLQRNLWRKSLQRNAVQWCHAVGDDCGATPTQIASMVGVDFTSDMYVKTDTGRPVIYIIWATAASANFVNKLYAECASQNVPDPYVIIMTWEENIPLVNSILSTCRASAVSAYCVGGNNDRPYASTMTEEQRKWGVWNNTQGVAVPTVTTGWDNRPRYYCGLWQGDNTAYLKDSWMEYPTLTQLQQHTQDAISFVETTQKCATNEFRSILIYAWNEYDEGGFIAPTLFDVLDPANNGRPPKLDAINRAIQTFRVSYLDLGGHWAADAIRQLSASFVFSGVSTAFFKPDQPVTVEEYTVWLVRTFGLGGATTELAIADALGITAALLPDRKDSAVPVTDREVIYMTANVMKLLKMSDSDDDARRIFNAIPEKRMTRAKAATMLRDCLELPFMPWYVLEIGTGQWNTSLVRTGVAVRADSPWQLNVTVQDRGTDSGGPNVAWTNFLYRNLTVQSVRAAPGGGPEPLSLMYGIEFGEDLTASQHYGAHWNYNGIRTHQFTGIAPNAFTNCAALGAIQMPATVTNLGASAFQGCANLSGTVTLPPSLTGAPPYLFAQCSLLRTVDVGANVLTIGDYAFADCVSLRVRYAGNRPGAPLNIYEGAPSVVSFVRLGAPLINASWLGGPGAVTPDRRWPTPPNEVRPWNGDTLYFNMPSVIQVR